MLGWLWDIVGRFLGCRSRLTSGKLGPSRYLLARGRPPNPSTSARPRCLCADIYCLLVSNARQLLNGFKRSALPQTFHSPIFHKMKMTAMISCFVLLTLQATLVIGIPVNDDLEVQLDSSASGCEQPFFLLAEQALISLCQSVPR